MAYLYMDDKYEVSMQNILKNKFLISLGVLSFVIVAFAFGVYFKKLGTSIMAGTAEWGQFGDFVGGTTSPLLSLLAFLGVLYTINQNKQERNDRLLVQKADETYKIIETIFKQIESSLENQEFDAADSGYIKPVKVARFLAVGDAPKEYYNIQNLDNDNICKNLSRLIEGIQKYCELYVGYGGSADTTYFFRLHYWELAFFLICTKNISKETFDYFEAAKQKK